MKFKAKFDTWSLSFCYKQCIYIIFDQLDRKKDVECQICIMDFMQGCQEMGTQRAKRPIVRCLWQMIQIFGNLLPKNHGNHKKWTNFLWFVGLLYQLQPVRNHLSSSHVEGHFCQHHFFLVAFSWPKKAVSHNIKTGLFCHL